MKKKYIKRIIGIGLLAAVVGVFVWFMQITVTNRDDNDMRSLRSFYMEDRDSLDMGRCRQTRSSDCFRG